MANLMTFEANPNVQQMRFMTGMGQQSVRTLEQQLAREKAELRTLLLTQALKTQKMLEPLILSLRAASDKELMAKLRDKQPLVRWFAADILSRRQVHIEKELIGLLKDEYPDVRTAARQGLVRLARGTDFGPDSRASKVQIERAIGRWQNWLALQGSLQSNRGDGPGETGLDHNPGTRKGTGESGR